jgi:glycosidase
MKKVFSILPAVLLFALTVSCGQTRPDLPPNPAGFVYRNIADLTPQSFSNYSLELKPYEVKIIKISNFSDPTKVDQSKGWWKDAVVYQLYVRSYYDSDGNGVGDFNGLVEKLDYITNLGATAIWTLPVFKSLHDGGIGRALGYEAIDYYATDPDYGTIDDFKKYMAKAHSIGVKVIMDMVINHGATNSEWFKASEKKDPKYKDWYIWSKTIPAGKWQMPWGGGSPDKVWHYDKIRQEYFYATWGGEFNFSNPEVRKEFLKIASHWLDMGVDGYRLDAIRYLIEEGPHPLQADTASTLAYMKEYQANIKKTKPDAMSVGEVWESDSIVAKYYMGGGGFDQCFSFGLMYAVRDALKSGSKYGILNIFNKRPKDIPQIYFANFLENHDVPRLVEAIGKGDDRLKAAAALLMTFPGTPYVYHGTEYALQGQYNPMKWDESKANGFTTGKPWISVYTSGGKGNNVEAQIKDPDSLWNTYKKLIALRKSETSLKRGDLVLVTTGNSHILAFLRYGLDDTIIVVANLGDENETVDLNFKNTGLAADKTYFLYNLK